MDATLCTDGIVGYYFAPWGGYADALHTLLDSGIAGCISTGPHLADDLAALVAAGVPQIPDPFEG